MEGDEDHTTSSFFDFFETGFLCVTVLAVLELILIDQVDLKLTEVHLPLTPSARITGLGYYDQMDLLLLKHTKYLVGAVLDMEEQSRKEQETQWSVISLGDQQEI